MLVVEKAISTNILKLAKLYLRTGASTCLEFAAQTVQIRHIDYLKVVLLQSGKGRGGVNSAFISKPLCPFNIPA